METLQTQEPWKQQGGFEVNGWGDAKEARINSIVFPHPQIHTRESYGAH